MSSRALRKLQRAQEEEVQRAKLQEPQDDSEDGPESANIVPTISKKFNAFDMLNDIEDNIEDEDGESEIKSGEVGEPGQSPKQGGISSLQNENDNLSEGTDQKTSAARRKKKRAKKGKQREKGIDSSKGQAGLGGKDQVGLDEIDLALRSLKEKKDASGTEQQEQKPELDDGLKRFYQLLAIDTKHLNALNEMKKLFGSVVLEGDQNEAGPAQGRRRGRGAQQLDLGGALAGRNSPISRGQGLAGLALRRNVFMLGKEEWPKATSGGLSMELVEKAWDFTTEYRFIHNSAYQDTQRQFNDCVDSMDSQRMIAHLQYNPYHISTLLQVSEIAKQQGDQSVAGDLLERALFSFGRSVHSSFHTALAEGKARLDFRRPENREFWLAVYRYIGTLGDRGTWRTAYEWAKLLLSLDPEGDPYCIRLILDQLAIRGGQFENFVNLAEFDSHTVDWGQASPNILISTALAHYKLKHAKVSRERLARAISEFPWIFMRLFQELDIEIMPKILWGKEPGSLNEKILTEAYVIRAKDIWNNPAAVSFLVEVAESVDHADPSTIHSSESVGLNECRHIMQSHRPALIGLLPRSFTSQRSSMSDPYPPPDNISSYPEFMEDEEIDSDYEREWAANVEAEARRQRSIREVHNSRIEELVSLRGWFSGIFSRYLVGGSGQDAPPDNPDATQAPEATHEHAATAPPNSGDMHAQSTLEAAPEVVSAEAATPTASNGEAGEASTAEEQLDRTHLIQRDSRIQQLQHLLHEAGLPWSPFAPRDYSTGVPVSEGTIRQNIVRNGIAHGRVDFRDLSSADFDGLLYRSPAAGSPMSAILASERAFQGVRLTDADSDSAEPDDEPDDEPDYDSGHDDEAAAAEDAYDDSRNQRWLAGQGMVQLREFVARHGPDEAAWRGRADIDASPVAEYARRVGLLKTRAMRTFVLDYMLQQGTSSAVRDLIRRVMAGEGRVRRAR